MVPTMLIKAQSVTKAFGPHKVLKDVSLQINEGDSIGLIGVNGAGKTTFLRILLGEMKPDTGELTRNTERIGYLEQFAEDSPDVTVRDVLGRPYGHIENIRRRIREIEEQMAPEKYVGRAPSQVTEFLDQEVAPLLARYPDEDIHGELNV